MRELTTEEKNVWGDDFDKIQSFLERSGLSMLHLEYYITLKYDKVVIDTPEYEELISKEEDEI
ncbi:MAG: hypothetical protein HEP71_34205 [Roseivirga sp.]|nr:hypothetical protein [Roseivirga sp.]